MSRERRTAVIRAARPSPSARSRPPLATVEARRTEVRRSHPIGGHRKLILDDFALQPLDPTETADFYQICVERHHKASTIATSNRTAEEWLAMMADPLLAQSAVDRLVSTTHELIIEGDSYRRRQKPSISRSGGASIDQENGDQHDHS
jgi:IstB-like ATP binding protein